MANFFRDLGKKSQDLFKKNYPVNGYEFELNTKTESAVELRTVGKRVNDAKKGPQASADVELTKKFDEYGIKVKGVAKTTTEFSGEFNLEPKAVEDLKVIVKAEHKKKKLAVKAGAEYKHENGTVTGEVTVAERALSNIYASLSLAYEGFTVGAEGNYKAAEKLVGNYSGKVDYSTKTWSFTGFGKHEQAVPAKGDKKATDAKDLIGFNFMHKYNSDIQLGAELQANVGSKDLPVTAVFGGAWTLEDKSIVRAKFVSDKGRLGLSWQQDVRENLTLTVASDLSLLDDTHKFGFGVKFAP